MANSRKYIPVDEIFSVCDEHLSEKDDYLSRSMVKTQIENFEKKAKLNFNKSYHAPPPPGTQLHLPKIGNYKPKILLSQTSREETRKPEPEVERSYERPQQEIKIEDTSGKNYDNLDTSVNNKNNFVLMGDVDSCIVVNEDKSEMGGHKFSNNPLFGADDSEMDNVQDQEAVMDFGESVKTNHFDEEYQTIEDATSVHSPRSPRSPDSTKSFEYPAKSHENPVAPPRYKKKGKKEKRPAPPPPAPPPVIAEVKIVDKKDLNEYPYIPPPDYDEDELTMDFNDDVESVDNSKIYKEFDGEDFAKYLSDDEDYEFDHYTWRKNIRYRPKHRSKGPAPPRPKSEISFSQNKKSKGGALKPLGKPKHEQNIKSISRSTIRDFSFADSKLNADRTVRSTSAIGRLAKRGKDRPRIETSEGSYEEFLRMRQTENGSNSSADSGQFSGDEMNGPNQVFLRSQPKEFRGKLREEKPHTVWQKLTWKFRRHVGGYEMS